MENTTGYQRPGNQELLLFYEYFHGDDSHGLGASHQTGWTSLVAELINEISNRETREARETQTERGK